MAFNYAEVVVDLANRRLDHTFHYHIPDHLKPHIQVGVRVLVPFQRRLARAFVVDVCATSPVTGTRDVREVLGQIPVLTREQIELARFMADTYLCPLNLALKAMIPPEAPAKTERRVRLGDREQVLAYLKQCSKSAARQRAVLELLLEEDSLAMAQLKALTGASAATIKSLRERELLVVDEIETDRSLLPAGEAGLSPLVSLNPAQNYAVGQVVKALDSGTAGTLLLHGITGSGKTEVYIRSIEHILTRGKQALVLVPEISLTPQTVKRFTARFGSRVCVLHSGLSPGERYDAWKKILEGRIDLAIGARSAVFAPFTNLGLIILDEEHEPSYRQENDPRYHAREVAMWRAQYHQAVVLLGSATPSLESYYRAAQGEYSLLELPARVAGQNLPPVTVVDMRQELKSGNFTIFSSLLQKKLEQHLEAGGQAVLFLNRRGYSSFVLCRDCGAVLECPHCSVSLTYHADQRLKCHYCNYTEKLPQSCPSCGSCRIKAFGVGTQRVEEEVKRLFPDFPVLRIDRDTVKGKGAYQKLLNDFENKIARVLVGTQMIAKGLDFPGVTLAGVITVDNVLHLPDFRARERTFQLITQVAGRAGRSSSGGEVIVQTYAPDDMSIITARQHDYHSFYLEEIDERRQNRYPPFRHLVRVNLASTKPELVEGAAITYAQKLRMNAEFQVLGPAPAPVQRIKDQYRWQIILKGEDLEPMRARLKELLSSKDYPAGPLVTTIDVDPLGI